MIVIHKKRNAGKTTELVEMLKVASDETLLLVANQREARRIVQDYSLENLSNRVISWDHYLAHPELGGVRDRALLIDNVDLFLQEQFIFSIRGVSINEDS